MKKLSWIALILCLLFTAAGCAKNGETEVTTAPSGADNASVGVSADEAAQMSTPELVEAVVTTPDITLLFSANDFRSGVLTFSQRCPAAAELLERSDNAQALLDAYRNASPPRESDVDTMSEAEFMRIYTLGILLAQPEVTQNMDENMHNEIESVIADKKDELSVSALDFDAYHIALAEFITNDQ